MFCTSCGKEIPNDSNFCIKCGKSIKKSTIGKITIRRMESFACCLVDLTVYMDGKMVGKISNGNTLQISAEIGQHKLIFDLWCGNNGAIINITEEYPNVYIDLIMDMGLVSTKPKIVNIRNEK